MAHFAKIEDGVVINVLVADQAFIDTQEGTWVQTSYNTFGGSHTGGGVPLRKNYAGIGFAYDSSRDAFIPPKPFNSWVLNEATCQWDAPVEYPSDTENQYVWDEDTLKWVVIDLLG